MEVVVHWSRVNDMLNVTGVKLIISLGDNGYADKFVTKYHKTSILPYTNSNRDNNIACNNG